MKRWTAVATVISLSGVLVTTALGRTREPVPAKQWKAAIRDYYASGLSRADSCAATVVARTHLPPRFKEGTAIVHAFDVHERAVCTGTPNPLGAITGVTDAQIGDAFTSAITGMTDAQIADTFGPPIPWLSGPRCWDYDASKAGTPVDGVRICFRNGVVSKVQLSTHG